MARISAVPLTKGPGSLFPGGLTFCAVGFGARTAAVLTQIADLWKSSMIETRTAAQFKAKPMSCSLVWEEESSVTRNLQLLQHLPRHLGPLLPSP